MNKFQKAYKILNLGLGCPPNCKICENGFAVFLPGEIEYLGNKLRLRKEEIASRSISGGREIWLIENKEKECLFHKQGRCSKREARPLDCRSYPAIPKLTRGGAELQ